MDDEQKQLKAVSKAQRAKATLDNESINDAFRYLDDQFIARWRQCQTIEGRDRLWQASQILEQVKNCLALAVRDGEVAKRILDSIETNRRKAA